MSGGNIFAFGKGVFQKKNCFNLIFVRRNSIKN